MKYRQVEAIATSATRDRERSQRAAYSLSLSRVWTKVATSGQSALFVSVIQSGGSSADMRAMRGGKTADRQQLMGNRADDVTPSPGSRAKRPSTARLRPAATIGLMSYRRKMWDIAETRKGAFAGLLGDLPMSSGLYDIK